MNSLSTLGTTDLIARFIDGANRVGSAFNYPPKLPPNSEEAQAIYNNLQAIGEELRIRKPIPEIRLLYDHPSSDVRYWAAGQFSTIDPEWGDAVYGAIREHLSTGEVVALVRKAQTKHSHSLSTMSVEDLAELYQDATLRLYAAAEFMSGDNGAPETENYNRIMGEIGDIKHELEARHALIMLVPLLECANPIIRRIAAGSCLSIASERAIPILEEIAEHSNDSRERMSAWWILEQWRKKQASSEH